MARRRAGGARLPAPPRAHRRPLRRPPVATRRPIVELPRRGVPHGRPRALVRGRRARVWRAHRPAGEAARAAARAGRGGARAARAAGRGRGGGGAGAGRRRRRRRVAGGVREPGERGERRGRGCGEIVATRSRNARRGRARRGRLGRRPARASGDESDERRKGRCVVARVRDALESARGTSSRESATLGTRWGAERATMRRRRRRLRRGESCTRCWDWRNRRK